MIAMMVLFVLLYLINSSINYQTHAPYCKED